MLIGILRATSKGVIPVTNNIYETISANRSFSKVEKLKDDEFYRKVRNLDRSELMDFIYALLKVWNLYLGPLFELSQDE